MLAGAAAVLAAFPLDVSVPVRNFETQAGYLPAIKTFGTALGRDGPVAFSRDRDEPDGAQLV
jgi:hypothetical protein